MDIKILAVQVGLVATLMCSQASTAGAIRDFQHFNCSNVVQPSSEEYLREYAPHMILHALDIDFIVKETGLCTSMLITLMEFQSGIVRNTGDWRRSSHRPFAELSDKIGFLPQLIDVTEQIKMAQRQVHGYWIPAKQPLAFLFEHRFPPGTPVRFNQDYKKELFKRLYRSMFMQEFYPLQQAGPAQLAGSGWSRLRIHGWNFLRRYSSAAYR
jgi:hypothetical protein